MTTIYGLPSWFLCMQPRIFKPGSNVLKLVADGGGVSCAVIEHADEVVDLDAKGRDVQRGRGRAGKSVQEVFEPRW